MSARRLMVIGAHSADFVWRAGGACAVTTANGGDARVIALSYGERGESGELWKEEGQTIENVKKVRHGEAERAAARAWRVVRVPGPGRLPARDRRRRTQADLRQDPRVRPRRADHPHRHRPVQPRPSDRLRRGQPGARPRRRGRRVERLQDDHAARLLPVRAPPARAVQLHPEHVRRHHARDRSQAQGHGGDEGSEVPPDLLRPARRPARQPRPPLVGQPGHPPGRGLPAGDPATW